MMTVEGVVTLMTGEMTIMVADTTEMTGTYLVLAV